MNCKFIRRFVCLLHIFTISFTLNSQALFTPDSAKKEEHTVDLTKEEQEFIKSHHIIRVVCEPSWPPFEFYDESNKDEPYSGINISLLETFGQMYGIQIEFIPTKNYSESIYLMQNGKADVISGYTKLIENMPGINFTDEIYGTPLLLVSSTGTLPEAGESIALAKFPDSVLETFYKMFPKEKYKYITCETPMDVLEKFRQKKTDYMIMGQFEVSNAPNLPHYEVFTLHSNYYQKFGISDRLGDVAVSLFNKAVKSLSKEDISSIAYKFKLRQDYVKKENELIAKNKTANLFYLLISTIVIVSVMLCILLIILKHKTKVIEYDDVTNLHTYNRFKRDVRKILKNAEPNEYLILSLNIDNFGFINDSFGFKNGNKILAAIGKHFIEEALEGEHYCRFYADNFVFFMRNPGLLAIIEDWVYKKIDVGDHIKEFLTEGYNLTFKSSVYYIEDPHNEDITGYINKANLALKLAKGNFTTHRTVEYTREMEEENRWNREITLSMNKAIENNEFEVYYQPKFRFSDTKIVGAEALIRWNNPEKGFLLPGKFIPLFEHNGFIEQIDIYVFQHVCEFLDRWNKYHPDDVEPLPITISFNLSRYHLYDPNLITKLTNIAKEYDIGDCRIEVELTESVVFDNQKRLVKVMNDIKSAGFLVSVDDFGSGYSSLNLLKDMPADVIKLDKEFLNSNPGTGKESIIIEAVIKMAKRLNMLTVAEGIETKSQSELLRKIGCDIAQGFYYSHPIPEQDYFNLLSKMSLSKSNSKKDII
ncbi:MAG: EAL domain-containing protein [Treponema sp.]|nr:EAL domain-containing protein [Treponema sp.]